MKWLMVVASVGILAVPVSAQSPAPIGVSGVNDSIRSEGPMRSADQFSARATSPLLGREVALSLPVVERGRTTGAGNAITWSYEPGSQNLTLSAKPETFVRFRAESGAALTGRVDLKGFRTFHRNDSKRQERMQNAFGAEASVEILHDTIFGIALIGNGSLPAGGEYTAALAMTGEEARTLVQSVKLEVSGTVRDYGERQAVLCGSRYIEPTLDAPREIFTDICVLSVDVRRVAFVDTRSGLAVQEWFSSSPAITAEELSDGGLWSPGNYPRIMRTVHDNGSGWAEVRCEVLRGGVIYRCTVDDESSQGWGSAAATGLRTASVNHPPGFIRFRVTWGTEGEGVAHLLR